MRIGDTNYGRWDTAAPAISTRAVVAGVSNSPQAREAALRPVEVQLRNLSAEGQRPTSLEFEATMGELDLVDASYIERCRQTMDCLARLQIDTQDGRMQATGFLVAPGMLMTNHHVLPTAETPVGGLAQFGYWKDIAGGDHPTLTFQMRPDLFFVNDEELDFAVVALAPTSTSGVDIGGRYLRLNPMTGKTKEGRFVTILQHPDGDPLQIALRENQVVEASQEEFVIRYRADTAHGSSGAPVFNDQFQIAALHSGGRIQRNEQGQYLLKTGEWVDSVADRRESEVVWEVNVGIRISRICPVLLQASAAWGANVQQMFNTAMAGGDVLSRAVAGLQGGSPIPGPVRGSVQDEGRRTAAVQDTPAVRRVPAAETGADGSLILPLALKVSVVGAGAAAVAEPVGPVVDVTEAARVRVPVIYDDLPGRKGFDRKFLRLRNNRLAPMPELTERGKEVAAPLLDGSGIELKYHKFSVWMHAERRLALFTAANVDWRSRPDIVDGQKTTRRVLNGFPDDNTRIDEQWVEDARIASRHQLPDVFFTKDFHASIDRGAFDKGHLVRRDDVCWGNTFVDIQKANGDTYHVTNCSPQISEFNQALKGIDNWGDLEESVEKYTGPGHDNRRIIIYSGPIFGEDDRWFSGVDTAGDTRVRIPKAYWKIVVDVDDNGPGAYAFRIEQDVVGVTEDELTITRNWRPALKRVQEIEDQLRGWVSLEALKPIDRHDEALTRLVDEQG